MTIYNNNRFTPGNKGNLRLFMNKAFIRQYYQAFNTSQIFENINNEDDITNGTLCGCIPQRANIIKQGLNDPSQSENVRISQILTRSLGGKIQFGNLNTSFVIGGGGWEGQPGGLPKPLRNKF
jgi:hypothetical protein